MFNGILGQKRLKYRLAKNSFIRVALALVIAIPLIVFVNSYVSQLSVFVRNTPSTSHRSYWFIPGQMILVGYDAALSTVNSARVFFDNEPIPKDSRLPAIWLRTQPGSLERMVSNLPSSARERYYPASMLYPDGKWRRVGYRMRGRNYWHWDINKPSLRIKLRKKAPLDLQRRINLTNPEDRAMISNILSEAVGADMGVLTHHTEFIRLFLNGKFYGVYHLSTQDDESWLRLKKRFPGPIFLGESLSRKWSASQFVKAGDLDVLKYIQPMERMISTINQPLSANQLSKLWNILSKPKYARWLAAISITGSIHADYNHNQLFYFDPTAGLLEPAMADVNGYDIHQFPAMMQRLLEPWKPSADMPLNGVTQPLSDIALRDPHLRHLRNIAILEAINGVASIDNQHRQLDAYYSLIDRDALADKNKGAIMLTFAGWRRIPFDNRQYSETKQMVRDWIVERNNYLRAQLQNTSITARLENTSDTSTRRIVIAVTGHSAVQFDAASLGVRLTYDRDGDGIAESATPAKFLLHPGLTLATKNIHPRIFKTSLSPSHMIRPGTERYLITVHGTAEKITEKLAGAFTNAVTGSAVAPEIVTGKLTETDIKRNGASVHPWTFTPEPEGKIRLGPGVIELKKDLYIGPRQSLIVEAGTTLRLGPDVSILSHGKVSFTGDATRPIVVERLNPTKAWGAIVIHGESSKGSQVRYANISGGSWVNAFNVRYSGMLSVHWSDDIRIENTRISGNTLSDDTLHIVSSRFALNNVDLTECFSDCIDLDYTTGDITNLNITKSRNDGLDLMTSTVSLRDSQIAASGDKAISVGEMSSLNADSLKIDNSVTGLAVKDRSTVHLRNALLTGNDTAIDVFKKNWRFGAPGSIRIESTTFKDNQVNIRVEENGSVTIADQKRPGRIVGDGEINHATPQAGS